jgi:hypothetical protein
MSLYMIEHHHTAESCPRNNPEMVRQLSNHVSQANADKFGVRVVADFVYEKEHTLNLVIEADNAEQAAKFAEPFGMVGTVTIKEGETCGDVAMHTLELAEIQRGAL